MKSFFPLASLKILSFSSTFDNLIIMSLRASSRSAVRQRSIGLLWGHWCMCLLLWPWVGRTAPGLQREARAALQGLFGGTSVGPEVSRYTSRGLDRHNSWWFPGRARLLSVCSWIPQSSHKSTFVHVCCQILVTEQEDEQGTSYFAILLTIFQHFLYDYYPITSTIILPHPQSFLIYEKKEQSGRTSSTPIPFPPHHTQYLCLATPLLSISWKKYVLLFLRLLSSLCPNSFSALWQIFPLFPISQHLPE